MIENLNHQQQLGPPSVTCENSTGAYASKKEELKKCVVTFVFFENTTVSGIVTKNKHTFIRLMFEFLSCPAAPENSAAKTQTFLAQGVLAPTRTCSRRRKDPGFCRRVLWRTAPKTKHESHEIEFIFV